MSYQISFAAAICGLVPSAGGAKGPGFPGLAKAVGERVAYLVAEMRSPRWQYIPPPSAEGAELALVISLPNRIFKDSKCVFHELASALCAGNRRL